MHLHEPYPSLYEEDFALWLESQLCFLSERQFHRLDVNNLLDELGGILRSEKRELKKRLEIITMHLLKCLVQPGLKGSSWNKTLRTQRNEVAELLNDSPSLRRYVHAFAQERYAHALANAADETGLPIDQFPHDLPFTEVQLLDVAFVP